MDLESKILALTVYRADPDHFYREAIRELGHYNDRQFAKSLNRTLAATVFLFSIFIFLMR